MPLAFFHRRVEHNKEVKGQNALGLKGLTLLQFCAATGLTVIRRISLENNRLSSFSL